MVERLEGIQAPIRDIFYHHVGRIPGELITVNESMVEDTDIDHGAQQLLLELSPRTIRGCPLKLYVNRAFCWGRVGRFGRFGLIRYASDSPNSVAEYPDCVERVVKAVVYGGVVEEVWRWKGKVVRAMTWITSDGQKEFLSFHSTRLWLVDMLLWKQSKETLNYEAYVRQCG